MNTDSIIDAIRLLKPTAEFSFTDNDYSTIKWDVLEGDAPTETELKAAIKVVEKQKADEKAAKEAARQAVLTKLGLTTEEIAALLS